MKRVSGYEVVQYTYKTEEERNAHVEKMEAMGWEADSQVKRLKPHLSLTNVASLLNVNNDDREWFARFQKYDEVKA